MGGRGGQFRSDIQGLRAVAVLLVVGYHANGVVPGGYIGVDVFFVISGYVIALGLKRQLDRSGSVDLGAFYLRRIQRLLPAAALTLVWTLAVAWFVSPLAQRESVGRAGTHAATFRANLFFLDRAGGYFSPSLEQNPLLHMWSLSVEEQFYLALPGVLLLLAKVRTPARERLTPAVLGLIALGSFGGSIWWMQRSADVAFFHPVPRVWEFLAGVLLVWVRPRLGLPHWAAGLGAALGAALVLVSAFVWSSETAFPGWRALVPVAGTVLLIVVMPNAAMAQRWLGVGPLVAIGDRSYAWYLWHWPMIVFARLLWPESDTAVHAAALVSLGIAFITYRLVEDPVRHLELAPSRTVALGFGLVLVPALTGFGLTQAARRDVGPSLPSELVERSEAREAGCHVDGPFVDWTEDRCTWSFGDGERVMLLGDSHAASVANGVLEAVERRGGEFAVWTRSACPYSASPRLDTEGCADWQAAARELALQRSPDVVVIVNRATTSTFPTEGQVRPPLAFADGRIPMDRTEALESWAQGLETVIAELRAEGVRVVIMQPWPEFSASAVASVSIARPDGDPGLLDLERVADRRGAVVEVQSAIAQRLDGVEVLDPVPELCRTACPQRDDDGWLYYDDDHLSSVGAARLVDALSSAIAGSP